MKIELDDQGNIVILEVYSGLMMQTSEGNRLGICMRDDTFEINVMPKGSFDHCWHRVNMQTGKIESMKMVTSAVKDPDGGGD